MPKRTLVKVGNKKHYVERDKKGRFTNITSVFKSIKKDSAKKAKKVVKPGYGHLGDLKKKK